MTVHIVGVAACGRPRLFVVEPRPGPQPRRHLRPSGVKDHRSLKRELFLVSAVALTDGAWSSGHRDLRACAYTVTGSRGSHCAKLRGRGNSTGRRLKEPRRINFDDKISPLGATVNQKNSAPLTNGRGEAKVGDAFALAGGRPAQARRGRARRGFDGAPRRREERAPLTEVENARSGEVNATETRSSPGVRSAPFRRRHPSAPGRWRRRRAVRPVRCPRRV